MSNDESGKTSGKTSAFPGGGDDNELTAEFEAWDDNFDAMFDVEETGAATEIGAAPLVSDLGAGLGARLDSQMEPESELEIVAEASAEEDRGALAPAASFAEEAETRPPGGFGPEAEPASDFGADFATGLGTDLGAALDAELDFVFEAAQQTEGDVEIGDPEALGELLGTPTLPPPIDLDDIDDGDDVDLDAPPPPFDEGSGAGQGRGAVVAEEDGDYDLGDDDQEVLTSARRPREPNQPAARSRVSMFDPLPDDDELDPFARPDGDASGQITKVSEIDDELLAAAVAPEDERRPMPRRKPAIVRREDLARLREEREARAAASGDEDGFGGSETRVLGDAQLESLAAAETEVSIALDEDFYDDIVIDATGGAAAAEAPPAPAEAPARQSSSPSLSLGASPATGRRVSRHVVRRDPAGASLPEARKPVVRRVTRARADSAGERDRQLEADRELDPDSTLDLRDATAAVSVADAPSPETAASREDEIQAIIDKAAEALRSQQVAGEGAARASTKPRFVPPVAAGEPVGAGDADEVEAAGAGLQAPAQAVDDEWGDWDEPEWEEPAWEVDDEAASTTPVPEAPLEEVDVLPDLPPGKLPAAEPVLDLGALVLPEEAEPIGAEALNARSEEMAAQLLLYERELTLADDGAQRARLCLEAGRLAERLGDPDRARGHYEDALRADPRLTPAMRALRRIERTMGNWEQSLAYLDAELAEAAQLERHALRAHRLDILLARREHAQARAAADEVLAEAPGDVRALLARLELAFVARGDEHPDDGDGGPSLDDLLERLAAAIEDGKLRGALHQLRGRLRARAGDGDSDQAAVAFAEAAACGAPAALLPATREARRRGDLAGAAAILDRLLDVAEAGLAALDPAHAAALRWRQSRWAAAAGDAEVRWQALARAAALAPGEPVILTELAVLAAGRDDHERAAGALLGLGQVAPVAVDRAAALVRAAGHLTALGRDAEAIQALRSAQETDASHPRAAVELERILVRTGDIDACIELDRQAAAADPAGAVRERVRVARRLADSGRLDEAVAELEAGIAAADAPALPVLRDALDRTLARAGRLEARAALLAGVADDPGPAVDADTALWRAARASEIHACRLIAEQSAGAAGAEPDEAARAACERSVLAALEAWNRVLGADPDAAMAHAAVIRLAEMLGDDDMLEDLLARAQAAVPDFGRAVALALRRIEIMAARPGGPEPGRIEDTLREAWSLSPHDPRTSLRLTVLAAAGQRMEDAAAVIEDRAAALDPGMETASLQYRAAALLLDPADEPAQAASLLEQVIAARPGFAPAAELLQAARRRMGDDAPAPVPAPDADAEGSAGGDLRGAIGDDFARLVREAELCEERTGDLDRALALYDKALALRPGDALAREGLARAAERAGRAEPLAALARQDLAAAEARGDDAGRAAAHEALARVESTLGGDAAAAVRALEAALAAFSAGAAGPGRYAVVRELERAYAREQRWAELLALYGQVAGDPIEGAAGTTPGSTREAVTLAVERAHLAERLARSEDQADGGHAADLGHEADGGHAADRGHAALACYARAHALDPGCRVALVALEDQARTRGPSAELAALEAAIADYMAGDGQARAAFLTRAGETLARLGDLEAAVARFQEANQAARAGAEGEAAVAGGYEPALFGWRTAALAGSLWLDVGEAAMSAARLADGEAERIALFHLAGVAFMDRAIEGARARAALAEVLRLDPAHDDAFVRLRALLEEQGEHQALADLLTGRLDIETHPVAKARLHRELAALCRTVLDDQDGARSHLRAMLALTPGDLDAITALADLAWEQGAWQEAAEGLMARARMETDAQVLKTAFHRLGVIYAERLPDPALAIKAFKRVLDFDSQDTGALAHLSRLGMDTGDWKLAQAACERLIQVETDPDAKIAHLHRLGRIYRDGVKDMARAERAYRMALDQSPTSDAALAALVEFYEARSDLRSIRVHLDRVAGAMRLRLGDDIRDGTAYRVIARAMRARQRAGVEGSLATARCAAELALLTGAGEAPERAIVTEAAGQSWRAKSSERGSQPEVDELLYPASVSHAVRQVFALLGDRLAKLVGVDLRRYDVGRGDRVRDRDGAAAAVFEEVAREMGMAPPVLYISRKHPTVLAVEPTSPASVILGEEVARVADRAQLRFAAGRLLELAAASLALPARMTVDELGVLLAALLRLFDPEHAAAGVDAQAVDAQQQRLRRVVSGGLLQDLGPYALGIAGERFDPAAISAGLVEMGNRAGLLACGSIEAAMEMLRLTGGHADVKTALDAPDVAALARFAVSEDHAVLRGMLDR